MRKRSSLILAVVPALGLLWLVSPLGPMSVAYGAPGPHGGYQPTEDSCAACHGTHTAQGENLLAVPQTSNAFCYTCHDGTGAPATPIVSTHSNIDFTGGVEENFTLACVSCHEPHGSSNLFAIRQNPVVEAGTPITVGPVLFIATTGVGSFDDGTSPTSSRLCVACHESSDNQGFPMTNHVGAANHSGGISYEGSDCTGCHPHSADGTRENLDGFMPVGGCTTCHADPQDNGDNVPVGGRRAVTPDFSNNSHHVQGTVSDADCVVCHEMTEHQDGVVRLLDADTGGLLILTDPLVPTVLEPWCLSCHDADGANGSAPFSDSVMPPVIDATLWAAASHETSAAVGTCWNCHNQGHGSNKQNLLAPWDAVADAGSPDDPLHDQEQFCFDCHDGGVAGTDISTQFLGTAPIWVAAAVGDFNNVDLNDRHDVQASVQARSGAVIECSSCHDPHAANATLKVIADPDPTDGRVPGSGFLTQPGGDYMTEWCLDCHDGSFSADITAPTTQLQDVHGTLAGDTMGEAGGKATLKLGYGWGDDMIVPCLACHDPHTSGNLFHSVETVFSFDGSTPVPPDGTPSWLTDNNIQDVTVNGYNWCNTCHVGSMGDKKDNCFACHYHGSRW